MMRKLFFLLFMFYIGTPTFAQNSQYIAQADYEKSLKAWQQAKEINGNSYILTFSFQSWVGFGHITKMTIEDGKVVKRTYHEYCSIKDKYAAKLQNYVEFEDQVGMHKEGVDPITMDGLYEFAKQYLAPDGDADMTEKADGMRPHYAYFLTENEGLISMVGHVPVGCADDCFRGYKIDAISWLD